MKIECPIDPNILIGEIGDPCFSICDDEWNEFYRHSDHPKTLRIIDCENNQTIDVTGEDPLDSRKIAEALCLLLNQDYKNPGEF